MTLKDLMIKASQDYYATGTSSMSDNEFDRNLEKLRAEGDTDLDVVGHGYNIDLDTNLGDRVRHKYGPANSLDKCHNWKEYCSKLSMNLPCSVYASLKLDGMSIVLYYENGKLARALTRGNGVTGIDVTPKVLAINGNLSRTKQDDKFTGAVRGEILMPHANFEIYSSSTPDAANARNTTVGLVKSQDMSDDLCLLEVVVYNVVGCDSTSLQETFKSYSCTHSWLAENFETVVYMEEVSLNESSFMLTMDSLNSKWYAKYPADGIVLTSDIVTCVAEETYTYFQFDACAFKYPAEAAETRVIDVEWNLSKTKYLIPRVHMETVQLAGTSVSWAHGDNALNIKTKGIGCDAVVKVCKAGEIIPHIEEVVSPVSVTLPDKCPCCSSTLVMKGVHLACPNDECSDSEVQDALIWMNNISPYMGLGDSLKLKFLSSILGDDISIDRIYENGPIAKAETVSIQYNNFQDMYNMLFTNKVDLETALLAVNVPRLGSVTCAKLSRHPRIVIDIIEGKDVTLTAQEVSDIGNANSESILANISKIARLRYIKDNIDFESGMAQKDMKGKVVITGKLSVKRADFEEELKAAGYIPCSSVSKDTLYLITDDPNSSSSKNKQADKLGIAKISEYDFRKEVLRKL